jgi:hypothetical protein
VHIFIRSHLSERSLILRRIHKDAVKLVERVAEILGNRDGYNGQLQRWKLGHRVDRIRRLRSRG